MSQATSFAGTENILNLSVKTEDNVCGIEKKVDRSRVNPEVFRASDGWNLCLFKDVTGFF